jgi:ornithine carbamoyltransferase
MKQDEVGLGKREAVEDVARTLDRYLDILALRVFDHQNLVGIAANAEAPVINLLSDVSHPCQALADLQTIAEHRQLEGTTVTYVGDGNNVCHSLMLAGAMSGMHIRVAAPEGYEPASEITARASDLAAASGGSIVITNDPEGGVGGTDVVYTDVWASMGQEAEAEERLALFAPFQVTEALFAKAAADAIFLHCLPAHRDEEVVHEVIEHERSFVFDQAENRMHAFKGLLLYLAGSLG